MHAGTLRDLEQRRGGLPRELLREELCSARRLAGLKQEEARSVRMPSVALARGILSADQVTADSQAGKISGPGVEDKCLVAVKSVVAAELPVAVKSAAVVDSRVEAVSMAVADSVAAALAAGVDKMKDSKETETKLK